MGKIADAIRGLSMPQQKHTQLLYLDEHLESLETKMGVLRDENKELRAEIDPLKKEVHRLEKEVKEQAANAAKAEKLAAFKGKKSEAAHTAKPKIGPLEIELISFLAHVRTLDCTTAKMAGAIRKIDGFKHVTEMQIDVALHNLSDAGYIGFMLSMTGSRGNHWTLELPGKKFAVENGLDAN